MREIRRATTFSILKLNLLFIFVSCFTSSFAQQTKSDSLQILVEKDKEDTMKVIHLNQLSRECFLSGDYSKGIECANEAVSLAQKLNYTPGLGLGYNYVGNIYRNQGNYTAAIDNYFKALKVAEELHDKNGEARNLSSIGNVYMNQREYPKALDHYQQALKISEEIGSKSKIGIQLGNIGLVYYYENDFPKALDYYFKALKIDEQLSDKSYEASDLGNIGLVYQDQGDSIKALDYYFKTLNLFQQLEDKNNETIILGNIGALYADLNKYDEAEKYLFQALAIDSTIGYLLHEENTHEQLRDLYIKTKHFELALEHYQKAMVIKDSLFTEEKKTEIAKKELNFQFEKKETEQKAEQDKKDAISQIVIYSVSAGFVLVLLLAIFIFRGYRQKQKANEIISMQKLILEDRQERIFDSLIYAKKIQKSMMPSENYISKNLNRLNKN